METLTFAMWQTGKEAPTLPNKAPWELMFDPRDRCKDQIRLRRNAANSQMENVYGNFETVRDDGPDEMGWPAEAGLGREGRTRLWNH
jgi:hypothetical protein